MQTCAVTGANGYVGSQISAALTRSGIDVIPLGRSPGERGIAWTLESEASVADALRSSRVTALVHSAWDFTRADASQNRAVNVEGSRRLVRDAVSAGVKDLVFISTISAFADARSNYGRSKLEVEQLVLEQGGTVIRPGLVWGNGHGGMFGNVREQVKHGGLVPIVGDGRFPQYLVHEDDLGSAVVRAVRGEFRGTLTVAHPTPWLLRDLVLRLAADEGKRVRLVGVPWRMIYAALKTAELLRVKLTFRSDSVTSLVYQDPAPRFSAEVPARAFQ